MKFRMSSFSTVCITVGLFHNACCVRDVIINIPKNPIVGSTIRLECDIKYDVGDKIYSVSWFKDNWHFYRFTPSASPQSKEFYEWPLNVNTKESTQNVVVLEQIHSESSGTYTCQVEWGSPSYTIIAAQGEMIVDSVNDGIVENSSSVIDHKEGDY